MGTRIKIFREPYTKDGLRKLESDINSFLAAGNCLQNQSFIITPTYGDDDGDAWILFTLQYLHEDKKHLDPEPWWGPGDDAAAQKSKGSDASKPGPDLPTLY